MPIYDYDCTACRHRVEVIHGINDAGPRFCPSCGADGTMRKALATPAIHFKGSGWAKKDRASTSRAASKAAASSGAGDGASGDGTGAGASKGSAPTNGDTSGSTGTAPVAASSED